jgi:hypothetical protein
MERPNTIAGLQAKRKQLVKLRKDLERDARKVTCDLDHIDACIRLFDPASHSLTREAVEGEGPGGGPKFKNIERFTWALYPDTHNDFT